MKCRCLDPQRDAANRWVSGIPAVQSKWSGPRLQPARFVSNPSGIQRSRPLILPGTGLPKICRSDSHLSLGSSRRTLRRLRSLAVLGILVTARFSLDGLGARCLVRVWNCSSSNPHSSQDRSRHHSRPRRNNRCRHSGPQPWRLSFSWRWHQPITAVRASAPTTPSIRRRSMICLPTS